MSGKVSKLNVWAWIYGAEDEKWQFPQAGGEWQRTVSFDTLRDLLNNLGKAGIARGTVGKLGIVVHGDPGTFYFHEHGPLTAGSAVKYDTELRGLSQYLDQHGRLLFYSCAAALGGTGSALLNTLSAKYFPRRHVIGFTRKGSPGQKGGKLVPGRLWCSTTDMFLNYCKPAAVHDKPENPKTHDESILSEYAIYAKWSYNGAIIKLPIDEVEVFTEPRCVVGQKAVMLLLKDAGEREAIEFVAISKRAPGADFLWNVLQQPPYRFSPATGSPKLRILDEVSLRRIRQARAAVRVVDVVAFYKKKQQTWYRCASRTCRGHEKHWEYCEEFAKGFPNGPLE